MKNNIGSLINLRIILLGISVILFGLTVTVVYSSSGLGYASGTKAGLGIAVFGLLISVVGTVKHK